MLKFKIWDPTLHLFPLDYFEIRTLEVVGLDTLK